MTPTSWNSGTSIRSIERAGLRQRSQRALEGLGDRIVEIVERDRGRHRQPHALDRARLQRLHRLVREHGVEHTQQRRR